MAEDRAETAQETIVLAPQMASDFDGELPALVETLEAELPDVTVEIRDPLKGPPGTFIPPEAVHVLTAILPYAAGYSFDKAADLLTGWVRRALKKDGEEAPKRILNIYGPDGSLLKRVEVPAEEAGSEDSQA